MSRLKSHCAPDVTDVWTEVSKTDAVDSRSGVPQGVPADTPSRGVMAVTTDQVADVLLDTLVIGKACEALRGAGWQTRIAGNRISVNDEVFAQYISAVVGRTGRRETRWVVYSVAGTAPMRVVTAAGSDQS